MVQSEIVWEAVRMKINLKAALKIDDIKDGEFYNAEEARLVARGLWSSGTFSWMNSKDGYSYWADIVTKIEGDITRLIPQSMTITELKEHIQAANLYVRFGKPAVEDMLTRLDRIAREGK